MKKQNTSMFSKLFGFAKQQKEESLDVVVSAYSQPHVLQQRMKEANLTHGQTVRADITTVRLEGAYANKMILYFCPSQGIVVNEKITDGDGGSIPSEATLVGFEKMIPKDMKPGLYDLKNT